MLHVWLIQQDPLTKPAASADGSATSIWMAAYRKSCWAYGGDLAMGGADYCALSGCTCDA